MQLLKVEFVGVLDSLTKTSEPVRQIMMWADKGCEQAVSVNELWRTRGAPPEQHQLRGPEKKLLARREGDKENKVTFRI